MRLRFFKPRANRAFTWSPHFLPFVNLSLTVPMKPTELEAFVTMLMTPALLSVMYFPEGLGIISIWSTSSVDRVLR